MIFISISLVGLFCFFISTRIHFQRSLDIILVNFLLVCANIIASFEITSLLKILDKPWALIFVQLAIAIGAGIFYFSSTKKNDPQKINLIETVKQFFVFCKQHKLFTFLLAFIAVLYLFLVYLSIIFPQNTSDSLYNHLARIAHWLQQGSLKPYDTFSNFGITYPYNNSLLMMWSVLFLRTDHLVGLVQWFGAIFLALSIYGIATLLNFSKEQAGFSALIFLTFPSVFLESITAQNDILVAAFFLIGLYFLIKAFQTSINLEISFSALSFALAAGTKQYLAFAIPGILLLIVYFLIFKENSIRFALIRNFILLTLGFTLLFGAYAYIQNSIYYGNPIGPAGVGLTTSTQNDGGFGEKLAFNSVRVGTQFISCEGLPIPYENRCLKVKENIFRKLFSNSAFNPEADKFMLEPNCGPNCFSYSARYPLNEESAWFGILSWILILPGCINTIILGIHKKEGIPLLLVVTSFIYFLIISVFKAGWDPYVGRYLILSVALVMPFTGILFRNKTWPQKFLTGLFTLSAIFILGYSILSNDSKPIITNKMVFHAEVWGKSNSLFITKVANKLGPWFIEKKSVFELSPLELKTYFASYMYAPVYLVNKNIPPKEDLGIIADNGIFLDYLFFGDPISRKVYDIPNYSDLSTLGAKLQEENIHFLLINPGIKVQLTGEFEQIDKLDGWIIYKKK